VGDQDVLSSGAGDTSRCAPGSCWRFGAGIRRLGVRCESLAGRAWILRDLLSTASRASGSRSMQIDDSVHGVPWLRA
jgi:hypothetical protein